MEGGSEWVRERSNASSYELFTCELVNSLNMYMCTGTVLTCFCVCASIISTTRTDAGRAVQVQGDGGDREAEEGYVGRCVGMAWLGRGEGIGGGRGEGIGGGRSEG